MTIEDLRTYQKTKQTIRALEAELRAVYTESPKPNDNPGGKSSVRTASDPTAVKAQKAIQIREKLEAMLAEQRKRAKDITEFSLHVEDPEVGSIIRLHYIGGYTWEQTCVTLYGYRDRWYCHRKIRRYFGVD
jgi:hypothetical protein